MAFINWGKSHLTKHKTIDTEHKAIIEIINAMHERLTQKKEVKKLLYSLYKNMELHMENEKELMLSTGYKNFFSHNQEHEQFLRKMKELVEEVKAKEETVTFTFLESCRDWLTNHLELKDRKLTKHLNELKK